VPEYAAAERVCYTDVEPVEMVMSKNGSERIALLLVLASVLAGLSGCASDPRFKEGLDWVLWNEAEKKRLEDAGFPQYNDGPG
jgi:hypothetical protein